MFALTQSSDTDTAARRLARSCVATDHSGMSLRTRFRQGIPIVEVRGAVDARDAERLSDYVTDLATSARPLILDLRGVDFFGGHGVRALVSIGEHHQRTGARWAVVTTETVERLLHITNSNDQLPTTAPLEDALRQLTPHNRAWSVPQRVTPPEVTNVKARGRLRPAASAAVSRVGIHGNAPATVVPQPHRGCAACTRRYSRMANGPADAAVIA